MMQNIDETCAMRGHFGTYILAAILFIIKLNDFVIRNWKMYAFYFEYIFVKKETPHRETPQLSTIEKNKLNCIT